MPRVIDVLKARDIKKLIEGEHLTVDQVRRIKNTERVKQELEDMDFKDYKRLMEDVSGPRHLNPGCRKKGR